MLSGYRIRARLEGKKLLGLLNNVPMTDFTVSTEVFRPQETCLLSCISLICSPHIQKLERDKCIYSVQQEATAAIRKRTWL